MLFELGRFNYPFGVNPPLPLLVRILGNVLRIFGIGLGISCVFGHNLFYFTMENEKNVRVGFAVSEYGIQTLEKLRFSGNGLGLFLGHTFLATCFMRRLK